MNASNCCCPGKLPNNGKPCTSPIPKNSSIKTSTRPRRRRRRSPMAEELVRLPELSEITTTASAVSFAVEDSLPEIISTGIARLAILCNMEPSTAIDAIWAETLSAISAEKLIGYFKRLEASFVPTSACPFPMPAHILAFAAEQAAMMRTAEGEKAWQEVLGAIRKYFHPTVGWKPWTPAKPPFRVRAEKAAIAAGGLEAIYLAPDDKLVWIKKEFLKAYEVATDDSS